MWMQIFYEWCAKRVHPKPTLADEMREEAELLERDTVERELRLIDDQYKVAANRAKATYLLKSLEGHPQVLPLNITLD